MAKQPRPRRSYWLVVELFATAKEKGLDRPGWQPLSEKIKEVTGIHIPAGTLKYWHEGYSIPRVDEADLIAEALGYELDLLQGITKKVQSPA